LEVNMFSQAERHLYLYSLRPKIARNVALTCPMAPGHHPG
jgi:hypothetical protein